MATATSAPLAATTSATTTTTTATTTPSKTSTYFSKISSIAKSIQTSIKSSWSKLSTWSKSSWNSFTSTCSKALTSFKSFWKKGWDGFKSIWTTSSGSEKKVETDPEKGQVTTTVATAEKVTPAGNIAGQEDKKVVTTTPLEDGGKVKETAETAAVGVKTPAGATVGPVEVAQKDTVEVKDEKGNVTDKVEKEEVRAT